jgi:single-stranded-DNA-specific exonuclease RecJ
MMARIVRRRVTTDVAQLPHTLHPVLRRIYAARQVTCARELERCLQYLLPASTLKDIERAVDLLQEALTRNQRIVIVADFDTDGATSCVLAVRSLRMMGAQDVHYLVPNRFQFGYGLTPEIVAVAATLKPHLLITVDNGISSLDGVSEARQRGIKVLITDHHLAGAALPAAHAIVNPNQPGDAFASKNLPGVGVIFYVMLALRARLREAGWYSAQGLEDPNMAQLLDLVALGIVADVVPLDHNNRILVEQGLRRIRAGRCCAGVSALLDVAGRAHEHLVAADLGFAVAPRLNAAGRLKDMSLGIRCLLADTVAAARAMAQELDRLNQARRQIETRMRAQALAGLQALADITRPGALAAEADGLPAGLCLYDETWHQGVIGILAARIKDRLHRPVIAFAPGSHGELKGSARSIAGLHIRDVLEAVATRYPALIAKFGGHAMAAGLSLKPEALDPFREAFDAEVRRHLSAEDLQAVILSDGELTREELRLQFAELLREAGPWGQGFPEPVFDGIFQVTHRREVGDGHLKLVVRTLDGPSLDAIAFNAVERNWPVQAERVRLAYRLGVNEFRGLRSVQLVIEHMEDEVSHT